MDGDMCFNYGAFPRTWEDPSHIDARHGLRTGDNDPIDSDRDRPQDAPHGLGDQGQGPRPPRDDRRSARRDWKASSASPPTTR